MRNIYFQERSLGCCTYLEDILCVRVFTCVAPLFPLLHLMRRHYTGMLGFHDANWVKMSPEWAYRSGLSIPKKHASPGLNPGAHIWTQEEDPNFPLPSLFRSLWSPTAHLSFLKASQIYCSINASCCRPQRRHPNCLQMAPGDKRKVPPIRKAFLVPLKARSWLNKVSRHHR